MGKNKKRFLVAVILEESLAQEVRSLSHLLGQPFAMRIPPHITLMPPINLPEDKLDSLRIAVREAVEIFSEATIYLGPISSFWPRNPAIFIKVLADEQQDFEGKTGDNNSFLHYIFNQLSIGDLEPPITRDAYRFIPHITIGHAKNICDVERATDLFRDYSAVGKVDSVAILEQDLESKEKSWSVVDEPYFGKTQKTTLAGENVRIAYDKIISPYDLPYIGYDNTSSNVDIGLGINIDILLYVSKGYAGLETAELSKEQLFVITIREDKSYNYGKPLATAVISIRDRVLNISWFFVSEEVRGLGLGLTLVKQLERMAITKDCLALQVKANSTSPLLGFFEKFGYAKVGEVSRNYLARLSNEGFGLSNGIDNIIIMAKIWH